MKKLLHFTGIFLCTFFLCFCISPQSASASDTRTVSIELQYGQSEARDMLQMINSFRTNPSEAWAWNESDTDRITYSNLSPLEYDYELERIAMLRAAEIAVSFSHTRPNGTNCFTAYGTSSAYSTKGENIAAGSRTNAAVLELWKEANASYSGQGHRRNMLDSSFNAIGIGHVYYNGNHYWVQEFGYASSLNTAYTPANNSITTVNVETLSSYYPNYPNNGSGSREYYITFYANNGNMNETSRQTTINQRISGFPSVTRSGYTFKGWYTQPSGGSLVTTNTVFYSDTAVYAQWESYTTEFSNFSITSVTDTTANISVTIPFSYVRTYGITYGTSISYMPETRIMDCYATTSLLAMPLTGLTPDTTYYFRIYYVTETDRIESTSGTFTTKRSSEYIITFNANGGTVQGVSSFTTTGQKLSSLPNAYRENYRFDGWYTAAAGGSPVTTSTVFYSDNTAYAHWTYLPSAQNPSNPVISNPGNTGSTNSGNTGSTGSTNSGNTGSTNSGNTGSTGSTNTGNTGNTGSTNTGSTNTGNANTGGNGPDTSYTEEPDDTDEPVTIGKVKLKSVKNSGKGKIKVKWGWDAYSDGYQIAYSTTSKFSSGKTKLKNAGVFTDSKTISGLKKGKTYYVRVRAFQKIDGEKYYGAWSSSKKIKLKK